MEKSHKLTTGAYYAMNFQKGVKSKLYINLKKTFMKQLLFVVLVLVATISVNGQDDKDVALHEVKVGDVLEIGRPDAPRYKHIYFPKPNFIIKRGGIANYKKVEGSKVVVTLIKEKKDGTVQVKIKKVDGGKFLNSQTGVSADLKKALQSGELRIL